MFKSKGLIYSLKSLIPNIRNNNPINRTNQANPPLKNSQAACLKFQKLPHDVEYQANKITPITSINPAKISNHLFMLIKYVFGL